MQSLSISEHHRIPSKKNCRKLLLDLSLVYKECFLLAILKVKAAFNTEPELLFDKKTAD